MRNHRSSAIAGIGALALCALGFALSSPYYSSIAVMAGVFTLLGLSVNLVFGYLGFVSFGHAAFFGLGAYTVALLTLGLGISPWLAVPFAIIPTLALGALVGFASLRVGGAYFAIASMVTAEILRLVAGNWLDVTRGHLGLIVPSAQIPILDSIGIPSTAYQLVIVVSAVVLVYVALRRLFASPVGRSWIAVRESVDLAESIGIPTVRARVLNLTVSGGLAGLAGALLVPKILVVSPELFGAGYSSLGLLMVILGGKGTLIGPVLGGTIFAIVPELLRILDDYRGALFAILILLMIRIKPDGLADLLPTALSPLGGERRNEKADQSRPPARLLQADRPVRPDARPLLTVKNASKSFAGVRAVADLTFTVQEGEIVGLIGPNGAGKTTSLKLISGFLTPSSGTVNFDGHELGQRPPHEVAALGLVRTFQHTELYGNLSAVDNVMIGTHLLSPTTLIGALLRTAHFRSTEAQRRATAHEMLGLVGLADKADIRASDLPYGEQKLLAIALALAARPRALLLDEPAAGLNHSEALRLGKLLQELKSRGLTIVIVEHNVPLVMSICDRVVVLHHGEVVTVGTPFEVQRNETVKAAYLGMADDHAEDVILA